MKNFNPIIFCLFYCFFVANTFADESTLVDSLTPVSFTRVSFNDEFWKPRIDANRRATISHLLKWCSDKERFIDFDRAAQKHDGKVGNRYSRDSDVYKLLEGIGYTLSAKPDAELQKQADAIIERIAAAQTDDGYLNTYYQVNAPDKRWTDIRNMHELYCAGHLFEAAVAYFQATKNDKILQVAEKFAWHICEKFGSEPGQITEVPGHQEIELALIRLYRLTGKQEYLKLCGYFIDARGNAAMRKNLFGPYCQDHLPIREQKAAVGHAVRAVYLYAGVCDYAAIKGDETLVQAMKTLWEDVVHKQMYVIGSVGAKHGTEAFGEAYELPNESAYCETCAAVGLAFWAHRMHLLCKDAEYMDVVERAIYNGVISGVSQTGDTFFYVNPLASAGNHHRQEFFSTTCCPSNIVRFIPSLPGYVYATENKTVYVNLYVNSDAVIPLSGGNVNVRQNTEYPWKGQVVLEVDAKPNTDNSDAMFMMKFRVPGWCLGEFTVNGVPPPVSENGYAMIEVPWGKKSTINVEMKMKVQQLEAHPLVTSNRGRVALQYGPIVYCFEQADNPSLENRSFLAREPDFKTEFHSELLGGVMTVTARDIRGNRLCAVPYYAWDHRTAGRMLIWINQEGLSRSPNVGDPAWASLLYRPLQPASLNDQTETLTPRNAAFPTASFCNPANTVEAICDGIEPKTSDDHDIPRMTFWNHKGTNEWVRLDFAKPFRLTKTSVYWFDDERQNGGCRVPESWKLFYLQGDTWKTVSTEDIFGTQQDCYNSVRFQPVETTAIKLEIRLQPNYSGGILEMIAE